MAAIPIPNQPTLYTLNQLTKREDDGKNWAHANPGVVLVFCIVFIVGCGIISLFLYRKWMASRAVKQAYPVE